MHIFIATHAYLHLHPRISSFAPTHIFIGTHAYLHWHPRISSLAPTHIFIGTHAYLHWHPRISSLAPTHIFIGTHAYLHWHPCISSLAPTHIFIPVTIKTFGPWNTEGLDFIKELGRRTTLATRDPRETTFVLQRLSVAVQCGNAMSCAGTFPPNAEDDE